MSQAQVYVGEGLTMAFECNVMGVHSIFTSELSSGAGDEMEQKYELLYTIDNRESMVEDTKKKIDELLGMDNIRDVGQKKRERLLKDKKDFNEWWVDYLEEIL
jgi:hypothetical protein